MFAARNAFFTQQATAAGGGSAVAFDAVGAGSKGTTSLSYSITLSTSTYVLVGATNIGSARPTEATIDGTSMTLLSFVGFNSSTAQGVSVWGLSASAGTRTIAVNTSVTQTGLYSNAVAYRNVATVSSPQTTSGVSTAYSFTPTGVDPNEMVVAFMAYGGNARTPSGGTLRFSDFAGVNNAVNSGYLYTSDATTSTTFSLSGGSSNSYAAIGVVLSP